MSETIKIKYIRDIEPIQKINNGDFIDLRCAERTVLKAGDFRLIPLGIAMQLPPGYEAIVVPRSSTFRRYGIIQSNSIGVIDETYCGEEDEWCFPAYATRQTIIEKNDRICQFRIQKHQPDIEFEITETMTGGSRGGFGSTGAQ